MEYNSLIQLFISVDYKLLPTLLFGTVDLTRRLHPQKSCFHCYCYSNTPRRAMKMMMYGLSLSLFSALLIQSVPQVNGGTAKLLPVESVRTTTTAQQQESQPQQGFRQPDHASLPDFTHGPTPAERAREKEARNQRHRERRATMQETLKHMRPDTVELVDADDLVKKMGDDHPVMRNLAWGRTSSSNAVEYADTGQDYSMWQQAYRMLGGFIDCDHTKDEGGGSQDNKNDNNNNNDGGTQACSRWMMWAAVRFI
jgi:hypothetical protein